MPFKDKEKRLRWEDEYYKKRSLDPEYKLRQKIWRDKNASALPYFHTDACQASLYLNLDVSTLGVDIMTFDGLKMHGPRGVGVSYVKNGTRINHVIYGGGQEKGLRSGTENLPSVS